jgi:hypothetical protein
VHYADAVTFNFNYDSSVVDEGLIRELGDGFLEELRGAGVDAAAKVDLSI